MIFIFIMTPPAPRERRRLSPVTLYYNNHAIAAPQYGDYAVMRYIYASPAASFFTLPHRAAPILPPNITRLSHASRLRRGCRRFH